jgi:hypothetical protein
MGSDGFTSEVKRLISGYVKLMIAELQLTIGGKIVARPSGKIGAESTLGSRSIFAVLRFAT